MIGTGLISFCLSIIFLILSQRYFELKNIKDEIIGRSSHTESATRNGGLSIFLSLFLISLFFYFQSKEVYNFSYIIPIGILFTIGLYDDVYQVDFKLKFIFQIIAAKVIVDQGLVISSLNGLLGFYEISYFFGQILSIFLIVLISNAQNFSDGIDGLSITEAIKSFLIIIFITNTGINSGLSFLLFVVICACVPFYYFNFKSSRKVFLGDSGSLFLGGLIAIGIINLINSINLVEYQINTVFIILICYLYPIVDLIRVVFLRLRNGESPFKADKKHIHHYLLEKGYSHKQSLFLISFSFGVVQIMIFLASTYV